MDWVKDGEAQGVVSFVRRLGDRRVFVSANVTDKDVVFKPAEVKIAVDAKRLISEKFEVSVDGSCKAGPYGYIAVEF